MLDGLQNRVKEAHTRPLDYKTIITFITQKFEISFEYYYYIDNPQKIYDELLDECLFINRVDFFHYMYIFSKKNSRIIRVKGN